MKPRAASVLFFILLLFLAGCASKPFGPPDSGEPAPTPQQIPAQLMLHVIDVDQGDSMLLQFPGGETMLVDAGTTGHGREVVSYLKSQGVKRIDYLVATHPHEDHIGGMSQVVREFEIGRIFMPRKTTNTSSFERLLLAVRDKGLKIDTARAGVSVVDQGELKVVFLAPVKDSYEEINEWSAVLRIQYGSTAFLLTGDAQDMSEKDMMAARANLQADVLKVGHHGSHTSSSLSFLKAVSPKYAAISCGKGNDYGHPHRETLANLGRLGIGVYRTDLKGTIVFTSDGCEVKPEG
ncbi:MAG: MBL fold metallo-hydrolase [Firmicutes bacterium]|nr:MBL fold metallo-hydrolase [Bacillota bacterium]